MKNFSMWLWWLNIVCIIFVVFGIGMALFSQTSYFNVLFNNNINPVFWGNMKLSLEIIHFQQWIYGVLGATCAGWGVLIWFIINNGFKNKESWTWESILFATIIWFVVDESISIYFRVYLNAIFNLVLITSIFIPLIFTRSFFRHNE